MDYAFEELGPERFQEFCQALLLREYPNVQCMPVGQPDGGRDAVSYLFEQEKLIVAQVKFVRNPLASAAPHDWLVDVIRTEMPKIQTLVQRGASQYVLLTNVPGTSHLDHGSIDRLSALLSEHLSVPALCLWRADLARRLDGNADLKWSYPELLKGVDILRAYLEGKLGSDAERRMNAMRAFVQDQFHLEKQVRFKQIELQNNLFDLFVDVPVGTAHSSKQQFASETYHELLRQAAARGDVHRGQIDVDSPWRVDHEAHRAPVQIGAATLLLDAASRNNLQRCVLEGAPGQGKSTITQYVCQVHRLRLLGESSHLSSIPLHHRQAPVRLPFRIDLRDLSTWLSRRDPFAGHESDTPPQHWQKTLESFLAAQVRHHSGGAPFDVADLHAVAKVSALLLVLDGLDEIADVTTRREVIDEIGRGVKRLEANAVSLQVIVTSRPAAFVNSAGFTDDDFPHFSLRPLTKDLIDAYADKWLTAKNVHDKERSDVKKLLKEKLDQPHLRELARNPMQLAILLALVHTRGVSLPDKRTALYDAYMELFFSRESEKSPIVREHRDLLIDIHRYLAWVLHTEAEKGRTSGSITEDQLRRVLRDYLALEGRDPELTNRLFTGMVERVVALVSRVQGTFEFEVQPLREYFTARYLYETAPYSPPGSEKRGTKPDRFDAMCRNFYWFNVTRFYAGCHSKGELPSIVDRLRELASSPGYNRLAYPRILTATLLGDWVFTQHPRSMKDAVNIVTDEKAFRYLVASNEGSFERGSPLILPDGCGRRELINRAFNLLASIPGRDYAHALCALISMNGRSDEVVSTWKTLAKGQSRESRSAWIEYGLHLGSLARLSLEDLREMMSDAPLDVGRVNALYRGRRGDYIQMDLPTAQRFAHGVLSGEIRPRGRNYDCHLGLFASAVDPGRYTVAFRARQPVPLCQLWSRSPESHFGQLCLDEEDVKPTGGVLTDQLQEVISVAVGQSERPAAEWASTIAPWDEIVERCRGLFGNQWLLHEMATSAAGIRSSTETCTDAADLFDDEQSLCRRARYARLRSGQIAWWMQQFGRMNADDEKMFALMTCVAWATSTACVQLCEVVGEVLQGLSAVDWQRVYQGTRRVISRLSDVHEKDYWVRVMKARPQKLSPRMVVMLALRATPDLRTGLYKEYLASYRGDDSLVWSFCQRTLWDATSNTAREWNGVLPVIRASYRHGVMLEGPPHRRLRRAAAMGVMPAQVAEEILSKADSYPAYLIALAEARTKELVSERLEPVVDTATKEGWSS